MHVCIASSGSNNIYPKRNGAIEPFAWDISKYLSRNGVLVTLFGAGNGEVNERYFRVRTISYKKSFGFNQKMGDLPIYPPNLYFNKFLIKQIFSHQKSSHPVDVLHINNMYSGAVAILSKKFYGIPSVFSLHNKVKFTFLFEGCDKILPVSKYLARFLIEEKKVNPNKISVLPASIDTSIHYARKSTQQAKKDLGLEDRNIVLFVGRKCPEKGPNVLIEALPFIIKYYPNVLAVLIGPDYFFGSNSEIYTQSLKILATALNVDKHIVFYNFISDRILNNFYTAADVVVCPSVWQEPLGKVVLEGLAYEKPVIATDVGGIPEIISNNINGLLIPPNDSIKLAKAITYILDNKKLSKELGIRGRLTVEKNFSTDAIGKKCIEIYKEVINKNQRGSLKNPKCSK